MSIRYLTDEQGRRTAVVLPIEEWEALQERLAEAGEELSAEEEAAFDAAWQDFESGKDPGTSLEELEREIGRARRE